MTIAVDWDIKHQHKHTNNVVTLIWYKSQCSVDKSLQNTGPCNSQRPRSKKMVQNWAFQSHYL